jgi:chromosome transmission fidelity protein 18
LPPEQLYSYNNKKVLLLHGPPGAGKSTLARVLAQHCKYNTIEINASDERTGDKILGRIKNAL